MPAVTLVFRPLLETRIACTFPGLLLAAFGANAMQEADSARLAMAVPVVVLGVVLAVRGYRMAVIVDAQTVTVRGMFRSRVVPRSGVDALHDGDTVFLLSQVPTMYWHDETGRARRTWLWMFGNAKEQFADVAGHNRSTLRQLRRRLGISANGDRRLRR